MLLFDAFTYLDFFVYIFMIIIFYYAFFKMLKALKPERLFEQGHIFEIKLFYYLVPLVLAIIIALGFSKILNFIYSLI